MAFVPINMAGSLGVVYDQRAHLLPPNAWTMADNIRFMDGRARRMLGHSQVFGSLNHAPYELFFLQDVNNDYWVYCGLAKVTVSVGGVDTDITRATGGDYAATANFGWNGGVLHGILVLNNAVDTPQMWSPPGTGTKLAALTAWPASTTAQVIRPFRNFLVALDITKSGTRYPYMVKWSHAANPGSVPDSWDETDATKLAGEVDIGDTPDRLVDCLPLGQANVLFKESSIHLMQYVGFPQIFRFDPISHSVGIFARRCATEFKKGLQCMLSNEDIVVIDGSPGGVLPIGDKRTRRWFHSQIDSSNYIRSFVVHVSRYNEVWICVPFSGASFPDVALVWNYRDNTFSTRDLPGLATIKQGVVDPAPAETWDATADVSWNTVNLGNWNEVTSNPAFRDPLMADPTNSKLFLANSTQQFDGSNFASTLERTGLAVERMKADASYTINTESWKFLRGIRPRIRSDGQATVNVHVGTQEFIHSPITWHGPYTFVAGQDYKIDCMHSARLFGIRFSSADNNDWDLDGYDLDIEPLAVY